MKFEGPSIQYSKVEKLTRESSWSGSVLAIFNAGVGFYVTHQCHFSNKN